MTDLVLAASEPRVHGRVEEFHADDDPREFLRALAERAAVASGARWGRFFLQSQQSRPLPALAFAAAVDGEADHSVQVRLAGDTIGSLALVGCTPPAPGSAVQRELEELAALAAPALSVLLIEALRKQLAESHAVIEVGKSLTEILFIEEVLLSVIALAESLVLGHAALIALRSEDDRLVVRYTTGVFRAFEGEPVRNDGSLVSWVTQTGSGMLVPGLSDEILGLPIQEPLGPGAAVPIQVNGEVIGAFLISRLAGFDPLTDDELTTLERLAAYAAIAIQNARIHQEQRERAEDLRARGEELQKAYQELEQSQQQLLTSEKMAALGRITAGIAHEINSPLGSIQSSVRTARGLVEEYRASAGDPDVSVEDHHEIADDMVRALDLAQTAAERLGQFVRSIKAQTRAGENPNGVFDPAQEIDSAVVLLNHNLRQRNVAVFTDLDRGLSLRGDAGQFGMIIQNLVSNAADAYEGKPGEIWVRLRSSDTALHIEVQDQGCGIPEEIRRRVFDHLFTTKDVGKGTGLGLSMVHNLVTSALGGEVSFDSEVGVGTTFRLTLPQVSTDN